MSIQRAALCLIVLPCLLPGATAHAGACGSAPCPPPAAAAPAPSPIDKLKSLLGLHTEEPRQAAAIASPPPRGSARKRRDGDPVPLPRSRPPVPSPAFPPDVFAAAPPGVVAAAPDEPAGPERPARLVDETFNELAVHDDDEHPTLKSALHAIRGRAGRVAPP